MERVQDEAKQGPRRRHLPLPAKEIRRYLRLPTQEDLPRASYLIEYTTINENSSRTIRNENAPGKFKAAAMPGIENPPPSVVLTEWEGKSGSRGMDPGPDWEEIRLIDRIDSISR
jgi:hypothetical protein